MKDPFHLVLDLETVPDPLFVLDELSKFPPPPCHQIVCIGYAWLENYRIVSWGVLGDVAPDPDDPNRDDEETQLRKLTHAIRSSSPIVVGFNSRGFDLPVIAARCLRYGIPHPWYYPSAQSPSPRTRRRSPDPRYRYSDEAHLDLMDQLADMGGAPKASLDVWARLIGLPGKMGTDGSDVQALLSTGGVRAVADYCMTDVAQTVGLLLRVELLRGRLFLTDYQEAAAALLGLCEKNVRTAALAMRTDRKRFLLTDSGEEAEAAE